MEMLAWESGKINADAVVYGMALQMLRITAREIIRMQVKYYQKNKT
jgi:hypothetical protein